MFYKGPRKVSRAQSVLRSIGWWLNGAPLNPADEGRVVRSIRRSIDTAPERAARRNNAA